MNLIIGSDHAGVELKEKIKQVLSDQQNINLTDVGPKSTDSVDYPDYAAEVAKAVANNQDTSGILICGSGIGMSIAANKINGIRAAMVTSIEMAQMAKRHNNANVLCLSSRMVEEDLNMKMVKAWLEATFEGDRHQRRIDKIHDLEKPTS